VRVVHFMIGSVHVSRETWLTD